MQRASEWASTQKAVCVAELTWKGVSLEQCFLWSGERLRLLEELIFHVCETVLSSSLYLYVKALELS